ncbi:MAG TPA: PIG-L deacetylase family protein [Gemmatimonadaceae bacterium]|nr:PIG-L deacetylase family protein [Gemmatimonadaceae bacterium]
MSRSRRASLVIVLAHPDDEIFHGGVLAHLSERGVRVTLVCATDGEAGKAHPSVGAVENLGALRVEELKLSCARLGIEEPVFLRFHDSARNDHQRHDDPHALANVDMLDVEAALRGIIADVRPHVIVTFEPHGGYYHPDHVAIQRATTAAFFSSGVLGSEAPERLFYAAMRSDVFRVFAEASRGRGILDGLEADVFATASEMIAVTFDASPYMDRKLSCLTAHRSAFGVTPETMNEAALMLRAFRPVLEREVFLLAGARGPVPRWPMPDFFDGLDTAELSPMRSLS